MLKSQYANHLLLAAEALRIRMPELFGAFHSTLGSKILQASSDTLLPPLRCGKLPGVTKQSSGRRPEHNACATKY